MSGGKMTKKLLWTQSGIASATGGSIIKKFDIHGISIDSRAVQKGDLFVAIKARRDGHYFIKNAVQNGASAALVSWKPKNIPRGFPVIFVKNTEEALKKLAKAARSRTRAKVIAITGSAGKTTTKDVLGALLSKNSEAHLSKASFNNQWGVPLSVAQMPAETEYGVFEVGMNHSGEIASLVKTVRPDIAIITTVGAGHIGNFASEEEIAAAKAEIFQGVKKGGTAIINRDNKHFDFIKAEAEKFELKVVTFGENEEANIRLVSVKEEGGQSHIELNIHGQILSFSSSLLGKHNAMNIASVMAALAELGADTAEAAISLKDVLPTAGRGNSLELTAPNGKGSMTLIDESYNANPLSMRAALENVKDVKPTGEGLKIAVLGEMKELGEHTQRLHAELNDIVTACNFDRIYLIGEATASLFDALGEDSPSICAVELVDVQDEILNETTNGSFVFVKGSNSNNLSDLVESFKKKHDAILAEEKAKSEAEDAVVTETPAEPEAEIVAEAAAETVLEAPQEVAEIEESATEKSDDDAQKAS